MLAFVFGNILSISVSYGLLLEDAAANMSPLPLEAAGGTCDWECDYCWCGTQYEMACPIDWFYDADCDCGCQFCDMACSCDIQDCGPPAPTGACCCPDLTCANGVAQAACQSYGCIYQGNGSVCGGRCPCDNMPEPCDYCWVGTPDGNNCNPAWYGDGDCDCGCQWIDTDCVSSPTGACCGPLQPVPECVEPVAEQVCLTASGAYMGDAVSCASVNCGNRCASECTWCWTGTLAENNCDPAWEGDGECHCGCQFCDSDCPSCGVPGACCSPWQLSPECLEGATPQACTDLVGAFMGDGVSCAAADCGNLCPPDCVWCWCGTAAENNCDTGWYNDGECDCGCQFCDPDCPNCDIQVCCAGPGDLNGDGLVDLEDHSLLPGCLLGPGAPATDICTCTDVDGDGDVDLQDVAGCQMAFEGS